MNRLTTLIISLFFALPVICQTTDTIHLWENAVPLDDRIKCESLMMADTSGQVIRITDVTDPILVAYHPKNKVENGVSVIICPGGGYHHLAMNLEGSEIAAWFNSLGITAFVLEYRVPGRREAALVDLRRALAKVFHNAEEWQIDREKIGVMGFSAGGHLAMRSLFPLHTIMSDGAISKSYVPSFGILIYPAYLDEGPGSSLSPEFDLSVELPPVFIFGTADDYYAHSALVMVDALTEAGHHPEFHLMPVGGHGYGMRQNNDAGKIWPGFLLKWMDKYGF